MDTNKMREEFEAWVLREWPEQSLARFTTGEYQGFTVEHCWKAWQACHKHAGWQPMETCPKHVEVLFFREDCGVISGQFTCADTFMTDKDRESGQYSEEEQYSEDAWCYGPDGVERLDGDLVPTHWMPYPAEPEVTS